MGDQPRTRMARPRGKSKGKAVEPPAPERVERAEDAVATGEWVPADARKAKVLFLVANSTEAPVNAEVEEREIRDNLDGKRFTFEKVPDVRAEDLFTVMRAQRPAIVHFSGHGYGSDGLAMKNRDGKPTSITARELNLHFKELARQGIAVRTVVLNACLAEAQAQAIAPYVDYVVGTSTLVGDDTAVTFAANFYKGLTEGRPVRAAFEAARARCGGEVEGTERIFRLFFSEPAAATRPKWIPFAALGAIAALAAIIAAFALGEPEPTPPAETPIAGEATAGEATAETPTVAAAGAELAADKAAMKRAAMGAGQPIAPPEPEPPPSPPVLKLLIEQDGKAGALDGATITTEPPTRVEPTGTPGEFKIERAEVDGKLEPIQPGDYTVTASKDGYESATVEAKALAGGEEVYLIKLKPKPKAPVRTVLCARDMGERMNYKISSKSCCNGANSRVSSGLKASIKQSLRGCTRYLTCAAIESRCK